MGLTVRICNAAAFDPDGASQQVEWDADHESDGGEKEVPGFGLRLNPGGSKTWILRYRNEAGRDRLLKLGRFPTMSPQAARQRAKDRLAEVWGGEDPSRERQEAKEALTVAEFADLYLERHSKPHKRSWREDERRIETYIKPALGSRLLAELTSGAVARLHAKVARSGKVEANRVCELLRAMLNKAAKWQDVRLPAGWENPASDFDKFREESRERWVTPAEMPALVNAINAEENPYIRGALWTILLTGSRKSALLRARWEDVDEERQELRLRGVKGGGDRTVPLSTAAVQVLDTLPRQSGNPYIFCGHKKGTHLTTFARAWRRVRKAAGIEDVTIHDLRRTVGSWLATSGTSLHIIGAVLGHESAQATRIYARLAEDAPRRALEDHAERLQAVATPEGERERLRAAIEKARAEVETLQDRLEDLDEEEAS